MMNRLLFCSVVDNQPAEEPFGTHYVKQFTDRATTGPTGGFGDDKMKRAPEGARSFP